MSMPPPLCLACKVLRSFFLKDLFFILCIWLFVGMHSCAAHVCLSPTHRGQERSSVSYKWDNWWFCHNIDVRNWSQVLRKNNQCSFPLSSLSRSSCDQFYIVSDHKTSYYLIFIALCGYRTTLCCRPCVCVCLIPLKVPHLVMLNVILRTLLVRIRSQPELMHWVVAPVGTQWERLYFTDWELSNSALMETWLFSTRMFSDSIWYEN